MVAWVTAAVAGLVVLAALAVVGAWVKVAVAVAWCAVGVVSGALQSAVGAWVGAVWVLVLVLEAWVKVRGVAVGVSARGRVPSRIGNV